MKNKIKIIFIFLGGSDGEESACNAGNPGSIPGLGRSPGEGHGNPLQYSCLENSMDRGAWQATQSMWLQRVRHDSATNKASYLTSLSFRFLILKNRINHTVDVRIKCDPSLQST